MRTIFGSTCLTGYEFAYRYKKELTEEQKKEYMEKVEGCLHCDKCAKGIPEKT